MVKDTMPPKPKQEMVDIVLSSYQPSKAELEADLRVDATFDESVEALIEPVQIRRVIRPAQDN